LETTLPSDKRIDQVDEFWDSDANEDSWLSLLKLELVVNDDAWFLQLRCELVLSLDDEHLTFCSELVECVKEIDVSAFIK
jgi:hypothetical protein